jgi:hypothetical protein
MLLRYMTPNAAIRPVEIKRSAPPPRPAAASATSVSKSVFVSNLPSDPSVVSCDVLRDAFGHCGDITNVVHFTCNSSSVLMHNFGFCYSFSP